MNYLTLVFPVAALALIALFYLSMPDPASAVLDSDEKRSFSRRDLFAVLGVTLLYALVAFYALGDRQAPQSFHVFSAGESQVFALGDAADVSRFSYYPGPETGSYKLEFSSDGERFIAAADLSHGSADVFKWKDAELNEHVCRGVRYIRITAKNEQYLGEIALRDENGELIPLTGGAAELTDEQSIVPDYMTYMNSSYFDEVYHPRTAFENLEGVYPYEVSHPPLGKLIIALGMRLFGVTPFGWRFCGTLFGVLMLPVLYVFLKKMFGGLTVPLCGTVLLASDFMHFTQTRIATIDTYAVFFMLLMYLFMYLYVTEGKPRHLALSGLFFGIGAACKWTCIYSGAGLAVIWLLYRIRRLREGEGFGAFIKNCLFCVVFFVLIPCCIYYASYYPYGTASGMSGVGMFFTKDYAKIVLHNQDFMFNYHAYLDSEHPYSSRWYMWLLNIRPILYYRQSYTGGYISAFGAFVNPILCWAGLIAMLFTGYLAFARRDRVSLFILIAYLAQLLPWVIIKRTTFEYHYFQAAVFLIFALCRIFSMMEINLRGWRLRVCGLTALSVLLFVMFYPAISGKLTGKALLHGLCGWLPTWPF